MSARALLEHMRAESDRVRSNIPPNKFRVVLCDRFDEESTIVGHTDTKQAAIDWADSLAGGEMRSLYVYDDGGTFVHEGKKRPQVHTNGN